MNAYEACSTGVKSLCVAEMTRNANWEILATEILAMFPSLLLLSLVDSIVKSVAKWKLGDYREPNSVLGRTECLDGRVRKLIKLSLWSLIHYVGCALFNPYLKILWPKFPFQSGTVDEWFKREFTVKNCDEGEEKKVVLDVKNVTFDSDKDGYRIQNDNAFPISLSEDNNRILFHGTNYDGAKDIIENGIDLTKGGWKLDFSDGDGFYLNDKLCEAIEWAKNKYSQTPAVLIYRVSETTLSTFVKKDCMRTTEESRSDWLKFVENFRSGKPDGKFLRKDARVDYVEGPMASKKLDPKEKSYQLCVRSPKMAEQLGGCVCVVLFLEALPKKRKKRK